MLYSPGYFAATPSHDPVVVDEQDADRVTLAEEDGEVAGAEVGNFVVRDVEVVDAVGENEGFDEFGDVVVADLVAFELELSENCIAIGVDEVELFVEFVGEMWVIADI